MLEQRFGLIVAAAALLVGAGVAAPAQAQQAQDSAFCKYFPKMCAKEGGGGGMENAPTPGAERESPGQTRGLGRPAAPPAPAPATPAPAAAPPPPPAAQPAPPPASGAK